MTMKKILLMSAMLALCASSPSIAQNSAPTPSPIIDKIPSSQDRSPLGPMTLLVDATDTKRAIFRVKQNILSGLHRGD